MSNSWSWETRSKRVSIAGRLRQATKNDKASILTYTIQMLKEFTSQVDRLKSEYAALTEESRELIQEKNGLQEEKASLKSDIENLNATDSQRMQAMYPWAGVDHSVIMHPPSYPFPMPVQMPAVPISLHPCLQPYPFYGNQNPAIVHNPRSTYVPYMAHNAPIEQHSMQRVSRVVPKVTTGQTVRTNSTLGIICLMGRAK